MGYRASDRGEVGCLFIALAPFRLLLTLNSALIAHRIALRGFGASVSSAL